MSTYKSYLSTAVAIGFLSLGTPVGAHHAFASEFDANKPVNIRGKLVKVEWINPHSWLHIEVKDPSGKTEVWAVEGGAPNALLRRGLGKKTLPVGLEVVVVGYRAKDGSLRANGRDITLPDGRTLFMASSGTGAPYDKK